MTTQNSDRVVRQSPSGRKLGIMGFARLSLSVATNAYSDGVVKQIPFDRIDGMSLGFGALVTGGLLTAPGAFRLSESGIYFVTTTAVVNSAGTDETISVGQGATVAAHTDTLANQQLSTQGNILLATLTPAPAADISSIIIVAGASGLILSASLLILQVG